jgi:peptide/nickel transport system permease protein
MYLVDSLIAGQPSTFLNALAHIILPAAVLAAASLGLITRTTRASMLETLGQDYIRTARAKGVRERSIVVRHGLRNALVPVVTLGGLAYAQLLSGAVMTETIFSWPGLGRYAFQAAGALDFPAITGVTLLVAVAYLIVNLLVDLSYGLVDPRIVSR